MKQKAPQLLVDGLALRASSENKKLTHSYLVAHMSGLHLGGTHVDYWGVGRHTSQHGKTQLEGRYAGGKQARRLHLNHLHLIDLAMSGKGTPVSGITLHPPLWKACRTHRVLCTACATRTK